MLIFSFLLIFQFPSLLTAGDVKDSLKKVLRSFHSSVTTEREIERENQQEVKKGTETYKAVEKRVFFIRVDAAIGPVIADFIETSLEVARKEQASLFMILLDTPGGLDLSMRTIIKVIESSPVPVIVFVYPVGARAASAGTFILMSSHIAAMAPGTSVGAAHPVMLGGGQMDETMKKKVENDAVSYIKALARKHGRNEQWAEKAVRESATLTPEEALQEKVVEVVANDPSQLLEKINGMKVHTAFGEVVIDTKGMVLTEIEIDVRRKALKILSDPNIAYILLTIGVWGIFFELSNPGSVLPGVVGAISLILGLYSLQTLPVNWAGLALIVVGLVLFILEVKIVSHGLLTMGGVLCFLLGSLMLFKSPEPFMRASYHVIISSTLATTAFFVFALTMAVRAQLKKPMLGFEGIIGLEGKAISEINPEGRVFVYGEYWNAISEDGEMIPQDTSVKVTGVKGLKLLVKKC